MRLFALVALAALLVLPAGARAQNKSDPYGRVTKLVDIRRGDLGFPSVRQWPEVVKKLKEEDAILDRCEEVDLNPQMCPWAAQRLLEIVRRVKNLSGFKLLDEVNFEVNAALDEETDMGQWGEDERWSTGLESLTTGKGDCEERVILKRTVLKRHGLKAADLPIIVARKTDSSEPENHALLAARVKEGWFLLNNGFGGWLIDKPSDVKNFVPLLAYREDGISSYRPAMQSPVATASAR